jgi:hypothetical protein
LIPSILTVLAALEAIVELAAVFWITCEWEADAMKIVLADVGMAY